MAALPQKLSWGPWSSSGNFPKEDVKKVTPSCRKQECIMSCVLRTEERVYSLLGDESLREKEAVFPGWGVGGE